jgi:N-acetylneuraminic acid mutarotase
MNAMKKQIVRLLLLSTFSLEPSALVAAAPLGTAFTYQGKLANGTNAAHGIFDLQFAAYDAASGGVQKGPLLTTNAVGVSNGLFVVTLDFGAGVFTGDARWLAISVKTNGAGSYTLLVPRQALTPSPYANFAPIAGTAASVPAANLTGRLADVQLSTNVALLNTSPYFSGTVSASSFAGRGALPWQEVTGSSQAAAPNVAYLANSPTPVVVTLPAAPAVGDIVRVSGLGPGGWRIAQNAGQSILTENIGGIGTVWTPHESNRWWSGVASSADGTRLAATVNDSMEGRIYLSADSGASWVASGPTQAWLSVACSTDGAKLVAMPWYGQLHTSDDYGATWTPRDIVREWRCVASSADGTKLVAVPNASFILTSTDSGVSWTPIETNGWWNSIALSAEGNIIYVAGSGPIHISFDFGASWYSQGEWNSWSDITCSADGSKVYAVGMYISSSTNYGFGWTAHGNNASYRAIACSADGRRLVTVDGMGKIYTSADSGVTWAERLNGMYNWWTVASSADGAKLVATGNGMQIYTSVPTTSPGVAGYLAGGQGSEAQLQYVGNGQFRILSSEGSISIQGAVLPTGLSALQAGLQNVQAGLDAKVSKAGDTMAGALINSAGFVGNGGGLTNLNAAYLTGTLQAERLAPGAVTAAAMAPGAAAANLGASGQSGVAGGGIIMATDANATNLLQAGYVRVGAILADGDVGGANWQRRDSEWLPDRRQSHTAVWSGSEMLVWGGMESSSILVYNGWRYSPATDSWQPFSGSNAPAARYSHTAVWLNGKMIVWGGNQASQLYCQTGGSYDPATDSWTALATNNAPSPRAYHTMVAAGTEIIVWGGSSGTNYFNDGARYDPATDTWSPVSNLHSLAGRQGHTAVWTGTEMILWGGRTNPYATGAVNEGGRYNPAANSWAAITMTDAPEPRASHTAVWTGTEMIVWGGFGTNYYLSTGARYNPASDLWTATATTNAPAIRSGHTAIWTGSEMIIWGGAGGGGALNTGGQYTPTNDTWSATTTISAPRRRYSHTALWTGNEMIVWGGYSSDLQSAVNTGSRYDPFGDTWSATSHEESPPASRYGHVAVWTGSEMIIIGGSAKPDYGARYNPATDSWNVMSRCPYPYGAGCTAVWTGSDIILWGGLGSPSLGEGSRYNPSTDTWTVTARPPSTQVPRMDHSAVWTGSDMIIVGGRDGNGGNFYVYTDGLSYNLASNSWALINLGSSGGRAGFPWGCRYGHTAVWAGAEMLVWGGYTDENARSCTNSGFRYPGLTALGGGAVPSARAFHTAVWTGMEMLIWGGQGYATNHVYCDPKGGRYSLLSDGWASIGTNGAPLANGRYGAGRARHTAVWTGREMIVWGGLNDRNRQLDSGGEPLNSGGRFNPTTSLWALTETSHAPSARQRHTAVWTGDMMLIFGGADEGNHPIPDYFHSYSLTRSLYLYMKP